MDKQQRRMLIDWTPMLKDCLVPSSLCDHITDFMIGTEAHDEIFNSEGATSKATIFIDILLASTTENIYDQFVLALMKSEDQVWLAPIFDDRFSRDDRDKALIYSTQMAKIYMNFRNWLKQGKINISVDVVLKNCILTKEENEEAERTCDRYGQSRAVRFIVGRLIRKGPGVLEDFYNALKEANIQFAETLFPLIEELKKDSEGVESLSPNIKTMSLDDKDDIEWIFKCKNCSERVTTSDKVRHIDNKLYFVIDPEFNTKALFENDKKEKVLLAKNQQFIGKIYCGVKTCRHPWGERTKYKSFYISVLKIKSFVLIKGTEKAPKQWKDVPFIVTKYDSGEE